MRCELKLPIMVLAMSGIAQTALAADVAVYGKVQVEYTSYNDESPNGAPVLGKDGVFMEDNGRSRLGVKAKEDLGTGVDAIGRLEYAADPVDGEAAEGDCTVSGTDSTGNVIDAQCEGTGGAFAPREAMVGLQGGFGILQFGRLKTPYKYTGGASYDAFLATALQARGNGGMTGGVLGHNSFLNDSMAYLSPSLGGLNFRVLHSPEDGRDITSITLGFKQEDWEMFASSMDGADAADYEALKLGGQVKTGNHRFSMQYEMVTTGRGAAELENNTLFFGYYGRFDNVRFILQVGQTDGDSYDGDAGELDAAQGYSTIGFRYKFSKLTSAFGGYRVTDDRESVLAFGLRKDFSQ